MKYIFLSLIPFLLLSDILLIDADKILKQHNKLRSKHFNSPLIYSQKLADKSQKWAIHLAKTGGCKMVHSHDGYGENLFWASTSIRKTKKSTDKEWTVFRSAQKIDSAKPVQDWYDEIKFYNYEKSTCKKGEMCGHYTQVVWKDSKEVGCAAFTCDDFSQVWVCKYYPAGNYVGQKPY